MNKNIQIYKKILLGYSVLVALPTLFLVAFVLPVRIFVPQSFVYQSRKIADTAYPYLADYLPFAFIALAMLLLGWYFLKNRR